jgi:bifunctional DNA-binding transcriptional regulator/antitoxin component of YhaV-PrlF toxin-antitoxin module
MLFSEKSYRGGERMTTVGAKYQMVIDREARQRLGVQPGWIAVQAVVGDRLEVRFLPPEHTESLAGSLRRYAQRPVSDYAAEKRAAWDAEVTEGTAGTAVAQRHLHGAARE